MSNSLGVAAPKMQRNVKSKLCRLACSVNRMMTPAMAPRFSWSASMPYDSNSNSDFGCIAAHLGR